MVELKLDITCVVRCVISPHRVYSLGWDENVRSRMLREYSMYLDQVVWWRRPDGPTKQIT